MKLGRINILGQEHTMCFSTRVTTHIAEKYGDKDAMFDAMKSEDINVALQTSLWLLAEMLEAGRKYAKKAYGREEEPVSCDDLLDIYGFDDLGTLANQLSNAIIGSSESEVVAHAKNAEATQGANGETRALRG